MDDQLAGRIVEVASSPLYAGATRIGTLPRALQMLGFAGTRDIAIALALGSVGRHQCVEGQALWRHALSTGWTCRVFARHARGIAGDAMFVAGLLHDLGLQILLVLEPESMIGLATTYGTESASFLHAEAHHFGFDHATLAGGCLRRWNLPLDAVELVDKHHLPVGGDDGLLYASPRSRAVLAVADRISGGLLGGATPADLFDLAMAHPASELMRIPCGDLITALETLCEHREHVGELD